MRRLFPTTVVAALLLQGALAGARTGAKGPFPYACDVEHKDAIRVLYLMADSVRGLPGAPERRVDAAASIRAAADTLSQSHASALHTPETKLALGEAVSVLEALPHKSPGLADKVTGARRALDRVDPQVPYLQQRATIDTAFRDISDALALATDEGHAHAQAAVAAPRETHKQVLHRWAFDQRGPHPDVRRLCNGQGATRIEEKRGAGQILVGILTAGMYVPVTARVTCGGPAPTTM